VGSAAVEQEALTWFNAKADGFDIAVIDIFLKAGVARKCSTSPRNSKSWWCGFRTVDLPQAIDHG